MGIRGIVARGAWRFLIYSTPPKEATGKTLTQLAPICQAVTISVGVRAPGIMGILALMAVCISRGAVWGVKQNCTPVSRAACKSAKVKRVPVPMVQWGNSWDSWVISCCGWWLFQVISMISKPPAAIASAIFSPWVRLGERITAIARFFANISRQCLSIADYFFQCLHKGRIGNTSSLGSVDSGRVLTTQGGDR